MNLNFIRGVVRPTSLLVAFLATIYFIIAGISIPDQWWQLVSLIAAYFFIERQVSKP